MLSSDILNELLQRENRVLHFWTMRKRRLDQCQQYVVFERSAKQVCLYKQLFKFSFRGLLPLHVLFFFKLFLNSLVLQLPMAFLLFKRKSQSLRNIPTSGIKAVYFVFLVAVYLNFTTGKSVFLVSGSPLWCQCRTPNSKCVLITRVFWISIHLFGQNVFLCLTVCIYS